jgi:branched-chain amino acid transport system substrate-binding protein
MLAFSGSPYAFAEQPYGVTVKPSESLGRRGRFGLVLTGIVAATAALLGGLVLVSRDDRIPHGRPTDAAALCARDPVGCVEVARGDPIKIGTLLLHDLESLNGVLLAIDFRDSAGKIAGHPVEFVHHDDGCSPEGGRPGARALAGDPQIVGVIGTSCSSSALGVADKILSEKGIILISPSNTGPALTDPANHQPFYLRTAYNDTLQAMAVARFAFEEAGARTASTIQDGSPYAESLQRVFADTFTSLGGRIVKQKLVQVGDTEFEPLLADIAADEIDWLYYPLFVAEGGLITAQARTVKGLNDTHLAGSDAILTPDWIDAAGAENAEGVYISGADPAPYADSEFYKNEYLPAYKERFGGEPRVAFHAYGFDAMNLLADAIEEVAIQTRAGGLAIPRTELRDRLFATEGFEGMTGVLTCNDNGDCQQEATMVIFRVQNGDFRERIKTYTLTLERVKAQDRSPSN